MRNIAAELFKANFQNDKHDRAIFVYYYHNVFRLILFYFNLSAGGTTDLSAAIVTFAMIGKLGVTVSFGVNFLYGTEIFPTIIR